MSHQINRLISLCLLGLLSLCSTISAQICHYAPLKPSAGKVNTSKLSIDFGEGDDQSNPQAWQGPLTIRQSVSASCTVDPKVSILEQPFYLDGQHFLVTTYSGSNKIVFIIDTTNCHILWHSKPFTDKVSLHANMLQLGKQIIKFNANCIPE